VISIHRVQGSFPSSSGYFPFFLLLKDKCLQGLTNHSKNGTKDENNGAYNYN